MIEALFGDSMQQGGTIRQVNLRDLYKVGDAFTLAMLAVNLRLPALLATQATMAGSGLTREVRPQCPSRCKKRQIGRNRRTKRPRIPILSPFPFRNSRHHDEPDSETRQFQRKARANSSTQLYQRSCIRSPTPERRSRSYALARAQ